MSALVSTSGSIVELKIVDGSETYQERDGHNLIIPGSSVVPPGMCERCFLLGKLTPAKVVHHKEHLTPQNINDPHYTLRYGNLQRLCQDCHAEAHSSQETPRVMFDENGDIIPPDDSVDQFRLNIIRLTEPEATDRNIYRRQN